MCGVFGVVAPDRDVARLAHFALHALQHRGQESAGIAVSDRGPLTVLRELGLVTQVFDEQKLRGLRGELAIGHTRYSTTGATHWANAQPLVHHGRARTVALGHNGNLTNAADLRDELAADGIPLASTSDSEVIAALLAGADAPLEDAAAATMARLEGAFSVVALSEGRLLAFRDAHGFRPLCVGRLDDDWVVASETCALDLVGATFEREVAPEQLVVVDDSIVRGNTTAQIVAMLFEAGAAEVHVRISSPPIVGPCFYGIDFAAEDELVASHRAVEEVRERIGATTLAYLSLEGLQASTRRPASSFCRACLTREYPTSVPMTLRAEKLRFERSASAY